MINNGFNGNRMYRGKRNQFGNNYGNQRFNYQNNQIRGNYGYRYINFNPGFENQFRVMEY